LRFQPLELGEKVPGAFGGFFLCHWATFCPVRPSICGRRSFRVGPIDFGQAPAPECSSLEPGKYGDADRGSHFAAVGHGMCREGKRSGHQAGGSASAFSRCARRCSIWPRLKTGWTDGKCRPRSSSTSDKGKPGPTSRVCDDQAANSANTTRGSTAVLGSFCWSLGAPFRCCHPYIHQNPCADDLPETTHTSRFRNI